MNESHAQFFRELRELCKKYAVQIEGWDDCNFQFRFEQGYRLSDGFDWDTTEVGGNPIDAAQKGGTNE